MQPIKRQARALVRRVLPNARQLDRQLDDIRYAMGSIEDRLARAAAAPRSLQDAEFKVFSQSGEDGIIQFLIRSIDVADTTFVEIGVQDYRESNTRFLAMHDNWRGVIIDAGTTHQEFLRTTETGWRWSIDAVSSFVTVDNVNALISEAGLHDDIGLLSVDIDGVDYWIWQAISVVDPRIVVVEYNSVLGSEHAVTVPYDPDFSVHQAHYSGQYFGASLAALHHLGQAKGYQLAGVCRSGVNAFFVRRDVAGALPDLTPADAFVAMLARTARDTDGQLTYQGAHPALLAPMRDRPLWRVDTGETVLISDLYGI